MLISCMFQSVVLMQTPLLLPPPASFPPLHFGLLPPPASFPPLHFRQAKRSIVNSFPSRDLYQTFTSVTYTVTHHFNGAVLNWTDYHGNMEWQVWMVAHLEGAHKGLVHRHHGASVVKLPAVVGGREEGDQLSLGKELVAILHHLQARQRHTQH